ncbi:MAG: cysteine hydrolase [Thermoplasmata archaeon]|nr:cysteine hydrolase [Thermoplasmata archaeon]
MGLLVMDLQRGIVKRVGDAPILERVAAAIAAARSVGVRIIYVQVLFRPGYPEVSPRNRSFSSLRDSRAFTEGDPDSAIHPAVAPQAGDVVVTKRRVGAFSGSDLDVVLRSGGLTKLVLTGIATSGVVLSTLRAAADLDFEIVVLSDGCADVDPEVHRLLTEKVFPRQAEVVSVGDWIGQLLG